MTAELLCVPPLIDIGSQIAAHSQERLHLHLLRLASRWWWEAVDTSREAWRALCERELGPLLAPTLLSHVKSFGPRSTRQLLDSDKLLLELLLRWDPILLPSSGESELDRLYEQSHHSQNDTAVGLCRCKRAPATAIDAHVVIP